MLIRAQEMPAMFEPALTLASPASTGFGERTRLIPVADLIYAKQIGASAVVLAAPEDRLQARRRPSGKSLPLNCELTRNYFRTATWSQVDSPGATESSPMLADAIVE